MTNLDKIKSWEDFNDKEITTKSLPRERTIEEYNKLLKGFRTEKLQDMMISLDDDSKFSDFYSVDELNDFEKQYGVPIKTGKDLEYLTFAVGEKLQELDEIEKQEELRKKEERKRTDLTQKIRNSGRRGYLAKNIRKLVAATIISGVFGVSNLCLHYKKDLVGYLNNKEVVTLAHDTDKEDLVGYLNNKEVVTLAHDTDKDRIEDERLIYKLGSDGNLLYLIEYWIDHDKNGVYSEDEKYEF